MDRMVIEGPTGAPLWVTPEQAERIAAMSDAEQKEAKAQFKAAQTDLAEVLKKYYPEGA